MVLTGSIRRSPEEWLPFLLGRESLCPWCSLSSRSLWSVLSLSCWGHWGHWFRSHADGTAYLKASTQRWKCSADMLGEEMALPRGCCIKEGGARGCQGNRVSVLRSQLLLWKSYQLGHQLPLFPLQIFGFVTEKKNFDRMAGEGGVRSDHICSGERRFWVGLLLCPCPSRSWVHPNQSKRLVPMAGLSDVSKAFS